ncbi:uncharacterized protein RHIMIDRAFT_240692 [Rhizopus microsporus ATCC 52813]|uniref:SWIM-type domain-containing protein n=1 Tax=Rhizopus microsporus ATCC 52813 TaxID=1340429 RepID=A0A2G4SLD2_RHIZD|nr:uncharacterized protein RHIMIDRAFT_240692 [Rhizopus microsporus ATCC 52813]PHZ09573.1 hypothetical protein RHIMIDRAFT_240692 [Rhizopus microsporus ATCC 52813]
MSPFVDQHSYAILDNVIRQVKERQEFDQDSIHVLHSLFKEYLFESIHIAESKSVTKICCESGRYLFNVSDHCLYSKEEEKDEYSRDIFLCTIEPRYCSCKEFFDRVLCHKDLLMCRHLLAVIISDIFDMHQVVNIDNITFAEEYYKSGLLHP